MFTEILASAAKQKFIYALENNIPETGDFETVKCSEITPKGYEVCFELFSIKSGEEKSVTVTAKKEGRIYTSYLARGTSAEVFEWLEGIDEKELAQKADEAVYGCGSFYYP
ncbi:MAG: hypothetical protein IJ306_06950 [Oscillospiraceae bacterium]|nr:hypothetical protein [Oscillospiraceae bacterium]